MSQTRTIAITSDVTDEFLEDVLTTAIETGYDWFVFYDAVRHPDGHERKWSATSCVAVEVDCDGDGKDLSETKIDLDKVCEAIGKITSGAVAIAAHHKATIAAAVSTNDASMIDADLADCILQAACFDEIRYG